MNPTNTFYVIRSPVEEMVWKFYTHHQGLFAWGYGLFTLFVFVFVLLVFVVVFYNIFKMR